MSTRMKEIVKLPINLQRKTHIPKSFMVVSHMALTYWLVVGGMIHRRMSRLFGKSFYDNTYVLEILSRTNGLLSEELSLRLLSMQMARESTRRYSAAFVPYE
jgi:hypothetical protein